jgi:CRP/FNR family transcriptional regulator, anaerobic regulatory protein
MSVQDRRTVRAAGNSTSSVAPQIAAATRVFAATEWLFRTGEAKTCLYRVNSGAVCLYGQRGAQQATIGFAFPSDLVGLGFLETHTCCARAVTETEVTCLPLEALTSAIGDDPEAQAKLDDAIEREFEFLRSALVEAGRSASIERVAAFLASLSRINRHEGRDPGIVGELCTSGVVADLLGLSIEQLSALLLELERRGLIQADASAGIRLKDISALEKLAAGGAPLRTNSETDIAAPQASV